ncbi:MAG: AMP-dependent synthetase/ligase [Propionibacteriaceae bacterium]
MTDTLEARLADRDPTVGAMFLDQVAKSGPREAYRYPDGGGWASLTWDQTKDEVFTLAAGLLSLGLAKEQRVSIASNTTMRWILADLAVMCAGGATTTIYPTTQHEDVSYILADSDTRIAIVEDAEQVAKVVDHLADLANLTHIIIMSGTADHERVLSWDDLKERGRAHLAEHPESVDEAIAGTGPQSLSTLIYTSGTTGRPKGVRLTHDAWCYEGRAIEEFGIISAEDLQYLWLPLSHVFGKLLGAIQFRIGFATAVDGRIDKIVENLGEVQPTFMAGAPRIFEKVRSKVMMGNSAGAKGKIFDWAFGVGRKTIPTRLAGETPSGLLGVQFRLADKLVFSKIKERMGGRIRFFISGSAALSREVQEWFYAADLVVVEGYGLTETSAATFVNDPRTPRFGTVGPPIPGTQVKIASDGEVLIKGGGVMTGYHNLPDMTDEVLTDEWFATGDIGEVDEQGYLRITDRKKDLIKTSGGKYVAPQKVEGIVKAVSPYISQIVVHGDGRKYVSALITLDPEAIEQWATENGREGASYDELCASDAVRDLIDGHIKEANAQLERWETIKRFELLSQELSVEEGEVTPSLKIRRKAVERKYEDVLNTLYDAD